MLFAGTEFGLWVSIDGGGTWAQFKGNDFPAVAVRDFAFQKRDSSMVLATHGRGIWIIDDLTPLRALDSKVLNAEATFLPSKPIQQRISAFGGWGEGDASFAGPESARRRRYRVLPEVAPSVRQAHDRSARRRRQGDRHDSRQRAPRHQPRVLVDARQTAARSARSADRLQLDARRADADRRVHRAHDQGRSEIRGETRNAYRPPRDLHRRRSQSAIRRRAARARSVRRNERSRVQDQRRPRAGRCRRRQRRRATTRCMRNSSS